MKTVDISLLGRIYPLACTEGQEARLRQLASMLEEKMRLAAGAGQSGMGEIRLMLLAGLMLADDVLEVQQAKEDAMHSLQQEYNAQEDVFIDAVEHLTDRVQTLAEKLSAA